MARKAPAYWDKRGIMAWALSPLTLLYCFLGWVDRKTKERKSYRPHVPVISVGNITVGGSGKTPVVALLAEHFEKKGEAVAILSRGYGGECAGPHRVKAEDEASYVGDEPKMLFNMDVANQVWVGADRRVTAKLAQEAGATLLILDDGFQHFKLQRDVDIVVVGKSGFGNCFTLPAGPLREPLKNLQRAHFAVTINNNEFDSSDLGIYTIKAKRLPHPKDIAPLLGREILAFCGLGNPKQFYQDLTDSDLKLMGTKTYQDHHRYTMDDMKTLVKRSQGLHGAQLVTTPKDAEKLPADFRKRCRIIRPSFDERSAAEIIEQTEKALNRAKKRLQGLKKKAS